MFLVIHTRIAELKSVRRASLGLYLQILYIDNLKHDQFFINIHHPLHPFFQNYNVENDQIRITHDNSNPLTSPCLRPKFRSFGHGFRRY